MLTFIVPGDPVRFIMGQKSDPKAEQKIREKWGLDKPWYVQYGRFLTSAVKGDLGKSYRLHGRKVSDVLSEKFVNTAILTIAALFLAIILGIIVGIFSAFRPNTILDYIAMTGALIGVSAPVFWLGMMLYIIFISKLHWISGEGFIDTFRYLPVHFGPLKFSFPYFDQVVKYAIGGVSWKITIPFFHEKLVLPAMTLGTIPMAIIARMTRSSMLEVLNLDYIRTARAKGQTEFLVIVHHALKNALIPIVTVIGTQFAYLLAGAVLTETVFAWPGLGSVVVEAIRQRDFPIVMGAVMLFAFVFVIVNLIVDILYAIVDPRIRYER
ncbi:ABC transporter permease [bacterium]|nr:ABC transporter permease [bacterium]MBU1024534.1 ABC transporter permease [bacterium]